MSHPDWSAEHADRICAATIAWAERDPDAEPHTELYRLWYSAGRPVTGWDRRWAPLPRLLRQAHAGARTWSAPTRVVAVGLAGTIVTRDGRGVPHAHPRGDYLTASGCPGTEPTVGTEVRTLTRQGAHVAEGWWRTWGGGWRPATDPSTPSEPVSRVYLAPRPDRLATLVSRLTTTLGNAERRAGLRWQVKVAADPAMLGRPDAVVVYLPDHAVARLGAALAELADGLVTDRRPPLTAELSPGVGWAQDPGDGDSFGESRCRLLATAFTDLPAGDDPLTAAADAFRAAGLDPAAPHLRVTHIETGAER